MESVTTKFLVVDYSLGLNGMIAEGNYYRAYPHLAREFKLVVPVSGRLRFDYKLFCPGKMVTPADVRKAISTADHNKPWNAAGIEHVLSFGVKHPTAQTKFPIIATGATCNFYGVEYDVCLSVTKHGERTLGLHIWWDRVDGSKVYPPESRFLLIRDAPTLSVSRSSKRQWRDLEAKGP
jgi:hypothetical protein